MIKKGGNFMKVTALLTGRGNNSLKDKNILDVLGKPVMYYPATAGKKSEVITEWYCSSDDERILSTGEQIGYRPILRPEELAQPNSQHIDCIIHALNQMETYNSIPDILVVILANNVTIKSKWITDCVKIMEQDMTISAVVPTYEDNDHHPLRAKKITKDGYLSMYQEETTQHISTNRQDLPKCVFLAHNFWVLNVAKLRDGEEGQGPWSFMGKRVVPYEIEDSIDIHHEIDLYIAKEWIVKQFKD